MSRSYQKHPWWKYCPPGAYTKKMANRRSRRYLNQNNDVDWPHKGNANSWEIHDYILNAAWERFKEWNWMHEQYFTEEEAYNYWKTYYMSR